ncbi:slit homolog 2 protein-like [Hydractinia symbiolongicarpus]|uniref:slit homolog 2 protein-like n=1 Tax=Hydractinia symbiolongicarpus TaxID=13093 RepID=UPI0025511130|nr:slit homolog 2 protein-like [Hydractinia symbiolongicarpus]
MAYRYDNKRMMKIFGLLWIALVDMAVGDKLFSCEVCKCYGATVACVNKNYSSEDLQGIARSLPAHTTDLRVENTNITDFSIKVVPANVRLRKLILDNNRIRSFPKDLGNSFPLLSFISVQNNELKLLKTSDFFNLSCLRHLVLTSNHLIEVNDTTFLELTKLRFLRLNKNLISKLHINAFKGLHELSILDVSENKIVKLISGVFDNLGSPGIMLKLNKNNIKKIPNNLFGKSPQISSLYLSDNKIYELADRAFYGLSVNVLLDLTNNNITSFQLSTFKNFKITVLYLNQNPLHCDCDLYKSFSPLLSIGTFIFGECVSPSLVKQKSISFLTANKKLVCNGCDLNPCLNNGSCSSTLAPNFTCACNVGYAGHRCEISCKNKQQCHEKQYCYNETTAAHVASCICANGTSFHDCTNKASSHKNLTWVYGIICFAVLLTLLIVFFIYNRRRSKRSTTVTYKNVNK